MLGRWMCMRTLRRLEALLMTSVARITVLRPASQHPTSHPQGISGLALPLSVRLAAVRPAPLPTLCPNTQTARLPARCSGLTLPAS